MEQKDYTIDATGKRLGRIATEAASILLGKKSTAFARHIVAPVSVTITHAASMDVSEQRGKEEFQTYSGYPGGLRTETLGHLAQRRGYHEVLRRVISGMIPKNRLHKKRMAHLNITD